MSNKEIPNGFKMTELGTLPEEWEVVKLGEAAKISSGGSAPQGEKYFNGKNPFVRVQHIHQGSDIINKWDLITDNAVNEYKLKKYPKRTIVFPKSGASIYLEKRAKLPIDAYIVSHLCAVISNRSFLSQDFLFYELKNLKLAKEKADNYPTLNLSEINEIKIPLPPLPEQRAIAKVLSTVQDAKEKTDAIITATKELKKSLMKHLFCYGPVSVEEAENVPLKETEIGLVPEEWDVVRLNKVCETKTGGTPSRQNERYYSGDISWVKSGELKDTIINFTEERITELGLKNSSAKLFPIGTLLIAMYGATVGKTAILSITASTNQAICAIFPNDTTTLSNEFLRYYFIFAREKLLEERYGGAQPNISQTIIRNTKIPLPPFLQQQRIAFILLAVDEKIEAEENKKKALDELFKTLLHNLMSAKIRVNELKSLVS